MSFAGLRKWCSMADWLRCTGTRYLLDLETPFPLKTFPHLSITRVRLVLHILKPGLFECRSSSLRTALHDLLAWEMDVDLTDRHGSIF